jgi:predicted membrane-bound mannosyltransferase
MALHDSSSAPTYSPQKVFFSLFVMDQLLIIGCLLNIYGFAFRLQLHLLTNTTKLYITHQSMSIGSTLTPALLVVKILMET